MLRLSLNKIKSIINPEKAKDIFDKQNLETSYSIFASHYKEPSKSFLKDIDLIKKCKLSNTERSLIWLLFLDIIPFKSPPQWNKILSLERESYSKLRNKYITENIEAFIELKRAKDSILYDNYKTIIKEDEFDLLNLIKIDIQRTYQENEIFKLDIVKKKLVTVLYIYAKENEELGYQQGMSDICGVFLYVLYKDFYLYNTSKYKDNILGSKTTEEKLNLNIKDIMNCDECELKKRTYILYYIYLKENEPKLFDVLINYVYPELFMMRWYLCVFTREFNLSQVLLIWDLIIMYEYVETQLINKEQIQTHLNFIEGVALSMLIQFKPYIMQTKDKSDIMGAIMHYPSDISIEKICKKAIEIYLKFHPDINV